MVNGHITFELFSQETQYVLESISLSISFSVIDILFYDLLYPPNVETLSLL